MVLDLKDDKTEYYATDISETMLDICKSNLQNHFLKYSSQLSFEEWTVKQGLKILPLNGE
jgi:methylase of polypeptide subunit release factors